MNESILKTRLTDDMLRRYYESGFWQDHTIYQIIRKNAERTPEKIAVRDKFRYLSYSELVRSADCLANHLAGSGAKAGDRVAVWLPNRLETVATFLACSLNRYVCCPSLHRNHTVAEVNVILKRFNIFALVHEKHYGADAKFHSIQTELDDKSTSYYGLESITEKGALEYPFTSANTVDGSTDVVQNPDSIVYLPLTSGTTGEPKGVMHSDNTLMANARAIAADWNINDSSVIYTLSPLSHNLGFGAMVTALSVGAEIVLSNLNKNESLIDHLVETGATFIYGVPAHAVDLLDEIQERGSGLLSGITRFRISGASASKSVVAGLLEHGIVPQTGYGMTEAHSHNYTLPGDDPRLIIESSGKACPGYELKIWSLDDNDIEVAIGEEGQIGGKGASLMLGYCDDEQATESAFNSQGWYMTGDIGKLDDNSYLHLSGRLKDIINRGGHKIHPAPIERLAESHEDIQKAAVIAISDDRLGERACLIVLLHEGSNLQSNELVKYLTAEGLSRYDMPEYFAWIDEMPVTPSGKIMKRTLLEMVSNGRLIATPV